MSENRAGVENYLGLRWKLCEPFYWKFYTRPWRKFRPGGNKTLFSPSRQQRNSTSAGCDRISCVRKVVGRRTRRENWEKRTSEKLMSQWGFLKAKLWSWCSEMRWVNMALLIVTINFGDSWISKFAAASSLVARCSSIQIPIRSGGFQPTDTVWAGFWLRPEGAFDCMLISLSLNVKHWRLFFAKSREVQRNVHCNKNKFVIGLVMETKTVSDHNYFRRVYRITYSHLHVVANVKMVLRGALTVGFSSSTSWICGRNTS